jgi:phenylacetate-CoA ligase
MSPIPTPIWASVRGAGHACASATRLSTICRNLTPYAQLTRLILAPALDLVRGTHTMRSLRELEESQWWPYERIQQLQSQRLQRLIHHAYERVRYYRALMDARGVLPGDIRTAADLSLLPVLTKADVRQHASELLADGFPRHELRVGRTGGSTGEPLSFYSSRESRSSRGIARALRAFEWTDTYPGDSIVSVTRRRPSDSDEEPYFERVVRFLSRKVVEDSASLSNSSLPFVVQRIARRRPRALTGFPSTLCIVGEFIRDSGIPAPKVNSVVVGGEQLLDEQRSLLRDVFGTEPFSKYSSFESFDIAMECNAHKGFHIAAEDIVVEIVDDAGKPVEPGRQGRVVVTNLHEYGMPLIRYDTDDESSWLGGTCACGRSLPRLSSIIGKTGDTFYTPSGKRVSARSFRTAILVELGIRRFQFVQDALDHVTVRVVPNVSLSPSKAQELGAAVKAHYSSTLGDDVEILVEIVDRIEPTPAGKHLFYVSKVTRPPGGGRSVS